MTGQPGLIYCDNAATGFPKPPAVTSAVAAFLTDLAVNPGRSGFDLALQAAAVVDGLRTELCRFFSNPAGDPDRTVFSLNATDALNTAIAGLCRPGDHVVATVLEHNSVLRPLHMLARAGVITYDLVPCDGRGFVDPQDVAAALRPRTRMVVLNHASNVWGTIQPAAAIGSLCREHDVLFLLDAAQTAGTIPVDMIAAAADLVAFTGHKGLQGPTGTGGLVVGPRADPRSTRWGGTGVRSAELDHPVDFPYRLEAGTLNAAGLAGLRAGLAWLAGIREGQGRDALLFRERDLTARFVDGCRAIRGLRVWGHDPADADRHLPVVSVTVRDQDPQRVGQFLDTDWNIAVRTGLHCAPLAHQALGTAPLGTVRFSFGPANTPEQIERILQALAAIAG